MLLSSIFLAAQMGKHMERSQQRGEAMHQPRMRKPHNITQLHPFLYMFHSKSPFFSWISAPENLPIPLWIFSPKHHRSESWPHSAPNAWGFSAWSWATGCRMCIPSETKV